MQLVARVEKTDPPSTATVCAAAALAAIAVVADERSEPDGEWRAALDAWQGGGRIRKLVRRARGAAWERAQAPDGATATFDGAEVRAYVPSPMDEVPAAVAKLQIRSTPLDVPTQTDEMPVSDQTTMHIAVTPEVEMSWGKQAAQCAHAGQLMWNQWSVSDRLAWRANSSAIQVMHPTAELWARLLTSAPVQVHDGGFTEIPAGTLTAAALEWPSR